MSPADQEVDVLLVGGGVASARCARTLRRHGFTGSILLVGEEDRIPYNRPPLSKELLRDELPDDLLAAEPPSWYERRAIDLVTGVRVQRLALVQRRAALSDGAALRYERLLLATGAAVRRLPAPGSEVAITLRTAGDARRLRRAALAAGRNADVVVVGGGFIGLEVASGLAALGLRPTVLEAGPVLWGGSLGEALAGWAVARLQEAGVRIVLESRPERVEGRSVVAVGGERFPAAFVVVGIGVQPSDDLAAEAGLRVDDGIVVDGGQRTSDDRVWAAGDVARIDGHRRVEHWHAAREAGERAGLSMLGEPIPELPTPWVFSEIAGVTLDVVGAVDGWDEERWLGAKGSILAYMRDGRAVGLAGIGGALPIPEARRLVAEHASLAAVKATLP
jgi:3-phenylpropionate/trans-cinnamate dioxygenase ferredoxin reductase component